MMAFVKGLFFTVVGLFALEAVACAIVVGGGFGHLIVRGLFGG